MVHFETNVTVVLIPKYGNIFVQFVWKGTIFPVNGRILTLVEEYPKMIIFFIY